MIKILKCSKGLKRVKTGYPRGTSKKVENDCFLTKNKKLGKEVKEIII
jgi:hypothetical protein